MPQLSKKAEQMPASPIRRLVPYANEAKARGTKVYHLNIGQPDIVTPSCALEAVRNNKLTLVAYSESAGDRAYREALVGYYAGVGIKLDVPDIMITTGGSEAILFAFSACMDPGDEVIIPEPYYANYTSFALQCGARVVPVPSRIEDDFALPAVEEFESRITPRTKAIMICNPNNPTGCLYTQEEIERLGTIAKKHDLFILSDEVYREFCYDGARHYSVMELPGLDDHTILLDSVSKRYSMCGVRVGAFISRNKALVAAVMKFAQARLCPPSYGQIAALAAIQTPKSYFQEVYDEYVARRNFMVKALNQIDGVYSPMPKGAFYTTVRLPVKDADDFAKWLLEKYSYKGGTVMMAPASGFYATPGLGKNEARLAYVLKREDLEQAMEILTHALSDYPGRV